MYREETKAGREGRFGAALLIIGGICTLTTLFAVIPMMIILPFL